MKVIHVRNIKKKFQKEMVLKGVNLDISGAFGLLGPNGAGKTTLIRILCSVLRPTEGEIYSDDDLNWNDVNRVKSNIGYLPQSFTFFKNVSVYSALEYIATLKGISKDDIRNTINRALEETNMTAEKNKQVKRLSGGMLRRMGIAQALLGNPRLIIVDEPTVGLDIEERVRFRQLLRNLGKDRIILISSHIVDDIETTCDHIGILKEGEVVLSGKLTSLLSSIKDEIKEELIQKHLLDSFQNEIISIQEQGHSYKVRYLTSETSNHRGEGTTPTLEDLYLYTMNKGTIK